VVPSEDPLALTAKTVYVSAPGDAVSNGDVAAAESSPLVLDVILYEVIAEPPVALAENVILSEPDAGTGLGPAADVEADAAGACGIVVAVIELDVVDCAEPAALEATTVKV